jgi:hypothetical protein
MRDEIIVDLRRLYFCLESGKEPSEAAMIESEVERAVTSTKWRNREP